MFPSTFAYWASQDIRFEFNGPVYAIEESGSSYYVGGDFTQVNGLTRRYLCKIDKGLSDEDALQSWDPALNGPVYALHRHGSTDDELTVGGNFTSAGGNTRNYWALYSNVKTTGSDPTLSSLTVDFNGPVHWVRRDLFAAGAFTTIEGLSRGRYARWGFSGSSVVVSSDDAEANGTIYSVADLSITGTWIAGEFTAAGGQTRNYAALFSGAVNSGGLDAYAPNPNGIVYDCAATSFTGAYFAGAFTTFDGVTRQRLALTSGTGVASASAGFDATAYAIGREEGSVDVGDADGVGGAFTQSASGTCRRLAGLSGGSFGLGNEIHAIFNNSVRAIRVEVSSGSPTRFLVGGDFTSTNGGPAGYLIKLDASGNRLW